MATGGTFTALSNALKRRYDDGFTSELTWKKAVPLAMVKKVAWSGSNPVYSMRVGSSPARSAIYSTAATISETTTGITRIKQPILTWQQDYGRATVDGLTLSTAGDKLGTFYDKFVAQLDGIMEGLANSLSTAIYRDGFGSIGALASTTNVATAVGILTNREDAHLFEVGMLIQFSSANSTAVLRNSGGTLRVIAIDVNAGTVTFNAAINTNTGTVAGDFMFPSGDREDSATPTRRKLFGFDAWLPTTAPSGGESFNNMDRSEDSRLQGVRIDATGGSKSEEEALIDAVTETGRMGGRPKHAFFNPTRFANLIKQGMARYRPTTVKGPANIGFDGVSIMTPNGTEVECFSDPFCPVARAYVIEMESWQLYGAGSAQFPRFLMHDGNKILRQASDDGVECRAGYYGTLGCDAPCHNAVINFG